MPVMPHHTIEQLLSKRLERQTQKATIEQLAKAYFDYTRDMMNLNSPLIDRRPKK